MAMLPLTLLVAAIFLAALLGGLVGGLLGVLLTRRDAEDNRSDYLPLSAIDPLTSEQIDNAAEVWADANNRPEAAGLVADKLRLAYSLRGRPRPFDQGTEE